MKKLQSLIERQRAAFAQAESASREQQYFIGEAFRLSRQNQVDDAAMCRELAAKTEAEYRRYRAEETALQAEYDALAAAMQADAAAALTQADTDALYNLAASRWGELVLSLSDFADADQATAHAKKYSLKSTAQAVEDSLFAKSDAALRDALLEQADGMEDDSPFYPAVERLLDGAIPASLVREAIIAAANVFGVVNYLK